LKDGQGIYTTMQPDKTAQTFINYIYKWPCVKKFILLQGREALVFMSFGHSDIKIHALKQ